MPFLKSEPAGAVASLDELFALAHAMETEAAARYSEFASAMRDQGQERLAAVFEDIAMEERGHAGRVDEWSLRSGGRSPDPAVLRWPAPPTFEEDDAAEMAGSSLLTPYRVLTVATRNEERAFAFWSYVAAHATRPDVRQAAEAMAKEELGHVASFRRERRRAFHQARHANPVSGPELPAWNIELQLAELLARQDDPDGDAWLVQLTREMAEWAKPLDLQGRCPVQATAAALAEALLDVYLEALDAAKDEQRDSIRQLAQGAVQRLAALGATRGRPA